MPLVPEPPRRLQQRDYPLEVLGERSRAIPGLEPPFIVPPGEQAVRVCEPDLSELEEQYVLETLRAGWISSEAPVVKKFETAFAEFVGAKYACATSSGTTALHTAVAARDIGPGSHVVVPTFTMASTANVVRYQRAIPTFVDCDEFYQMSVAQTRGVLQCSGAELLLPVHIYGQPVDIYAIEELAAKWGVDVIYDAAEAQGATYDGKPIGGFGLASVYSFYGNKVLQCGEGGMVVSNDEDFIDICKDLRNAAFAKDRRFWHRRLGYNYRLGGLQAAVGLAQCHRAKHLVEARQENRRHYGGLLGGGRIPGLKFQPQSPLSTSCYWMVGIEISEAFGCTRDELRTYLSARGIETRTYFIPLHLQPIYQHLDLVLPVAERLSAEGLYLPSSSTLTPIQRLHVASTIHQAHKEFAK